MTGFRRRLITLALGLAPVWLLLIIGLIRARRRRRRPASCSRRSTCRGRPASPKPGINDAGQIVGDYRDSSDGIHGFLYSGGAFTTIDVPGAQHLASGINDAGQIVGSYVAMHRPTTASCTSAGPSRRSTCRGPSSPRPTASTTPARSSGTSRATAAASTASCTAAGSSRRSTCRGPSHLALGINDAGQIVGDYRDASGVGHGFLYSGGVFTTIDVPGPDTEPRHQRRRPDRRELREHRRQPRLPVQRRGLHDDRRAGGQRHRGLRHQRRRPDRRVLHRTRPFTRFPCHTDGDSRSRHAGARHIGTPGARGRNACWGQRRESRLAPPRSEG